MFKIIRGGVTGKTGGKTGCTVEFTGKEKNVIQWGKSEKVEIFCPNLKRFFYFRPC